MEFNKIISASMLIASFVLVSCGDEKKKDADKVGEVPTNTMTGDSPKTDTPATEMKTTEPVVSELPKVEVAPIPESDAPHVETIPPHEASKSDTASGEIPNHNETKKEAAN